MFASSRKTIARRPLVRSSLLLEAHRKTPSKGLCEADRQAYRKAYRKAYHEALNCPNY